MMKIILSCNGITCILLKLVFHITIFMAEVKKYPNVIFFFNIVQPCSVYNLGYRLHYCTLNGELYYPILHTV